MALGVEALAFVLMRAEEVIARAEGAFSRAARRRAARGDGPRDENEETMDAAP